MRLKDEPTVPTNLDSPIAPVHVYSTAKAVDERANANNLAAMEAELATLRVPPPRVTPAAPTLDSIVIEIQKGSEVLQAAEATYSHELEHDPKEDLPRLRAIVAELQAQLDSALAELQELENRPSPTERFVEAILMGERHATGVSRAIAQAGANKDAQRQFGIPFHRLKSHDTPHELKARHLDALGEFNQFFARLLRIPATVRTAFSEDRLGVEYNRIQKAFDRLAKCAVQVSKRDPQYAVF